MSLWVVVGGQYGSEGKGKVAAFITKQENIDICVRCGGPNSGHSFVDEAGKNIILRQLPTGFINARTRLLIPAGALVDPVVLKSEIESLKIAPRRLGIDRNAFIIEEQDGTTERNLRLRERLSSTLCGVGAAQARRVLRSEGARLARDMGGEHSWIHDHITDVSEEANEALDSGKKVLIEGTQGFGLSLYHSEHYPKTTSRDTTAAGFLSEVGISPVRVTEIVVVFRTFPIRVAGSQAGRLEYEVTWDEIQQQSGYPFPIEERTSVTNKIRRVGLFEWQAAQRAVMLNRPTRVAVNGLDYIDYRNGRASTFDELSAGTKYFLEKLANELGVRVEFLGIGPKLADTLVWCGTTTQAQETLSLRACNIG